MRFWQKTYILTLLLFLFCLYAGVFSLAVYTFNKSVEDKETLCRAEQDYIASSFERDYNMIFDYGVAGSSPSLLMQSYGVQYSAQRINLSFKQNGGSVFSSFGDFSDFPGENELSHKKINGERYILITSEICSGEYLMTYGRYAGDIDSEFRTLVITYAIVAAVVSVFLAFALLFVLKKLSVPLERLKQTTERITAGDMTVSADESGKDEFSSLAKSFNTMVATVKDQMTELEDDAKRKQALVDNMAHELRTPLTTISGYAEYIQKAAVSDEEKTDAALNILAETNRLKNISEKILDTAFIRENSVSKQKINAETLVCETAQSLSEKAEKKGVTIKCDANTSEIYGDHTLLSMLLYNLAENAINACENGGEVVISCAGNTLRVKDNGKGMTKEQLSHIIEPFYRTDKSRSRADGGAGLGLALCRQIALSHGAKLLFESEPGKGTAAEAVFDEQEA